MQRLGESCRQFCAKHGWTECYNDVIDGVLRIHHLLVAQPDDLLSEFRRLPYRLRRLVIPLHCGSGVHQQLHQPFHLRRQVP